MQRETVAGPARDEREGGWRVQQSLGDLVHGAVAPDGDNRRAARRRRVAGEARGVAGSVGGHDRRVKGA
jgi:hypothetical protein